MGKVVAYYIGRPQGEEALYMYANSYYNRKKYMLAAYQFERFLKNYPRSEKAEEVLFFKGSVISWNLQGIALLRMILTKPWIGYRNLLIGILIVKTLEKLIIWC